MLIRVMLYGKTAISCYDLGVSCMERDFQDGVGICQYISNFEVCSEDRLM